MTHFSVVLVTYLGLCFLAGALNRTVFEGGGALGQDAQDDESSFTAARLELMVLRASLPQADRVEDNRVSIAPTALAVTVDQAAHALARIPKPIVCTANVLAGGILSVACEPLSSIEEFGLHNAAINGLNSMISRIAHDVGSDPANVSDQRRILLVCGSGERLRLSLADFRRWYEDYLQSSSVALGFDLPTGVEQMDGEVKKVIRLFHVDPPDAESTPPEFSFLRP